MPKTKSLEPNQTVCAKFIFDYKAVAYDESIDLNYKEHPCIIVGKYRATFLSGVSETQNYRMKKKTK